MRTCLKLLKVTKNQKLCHSSTTCSTRWTLKIQMSKKTRISSIIPTKIRIHSRKTKTCRLYPNSSTNWTQYNQYKYHTIRRSTVGSCRGLKVFCQVSSKLAVRSSRKYGPRNKQELVAQLTGRLCETKLTKLSRSKRSQANPNSYKLHRITNKQADLFQVPPKSLSILQVCIDKIHTR